MFDIVAGALLNPPADRFSLYGTHNNQFRFKRDIVGGHGIRPPLCDLNVLHFISFNSC